MLGVDYRYRARFRVKRCGIPHLAKNERDTPNFLFAALDTAACAPFCKERRMKFSEPTRLHRKSGVRGTLCSAAGIDLQVKFCFKDLVQGYVLRGIGDAVCDRDYGGGDGGGGQEKG